MNKVIRISIIIFFIGIIGSFFTIGESLFVGLRYISPIAIILLSLLSKRKIVISKSEMIVLFLFVLIFFIYPITLMLLNIYEIGKQNIIVNSLYYVITIVSCFFIASYYKSTNKQDFFKDFGLVGCIFLIVGLLMFRDISFSISGLLNNLIANERGERSYLGFTNPNQVAILTSLVIHSIIISQLNKKIKMIVVLLCSVILINTGSRTPLVSIVFAGIVILLFSFFNKKTTSLSKVMPKVLVIDLIILIVISLIYSLNDASIDLYYKLDILSTNRISRQVATITWLNATNVLPFGLGMFNPSFFNSQPNFLFLHTDSYYTYIIATMGIVGLLGNLILICYMGYVMLKNKSSLLVYILSFCVCYGFFEATLFFPTSVLTILLLISFFLYNNERESELIA